MVQKTRSLGESLTGTGGAAAANKVKRGDIRHAIIVRTKKKVQRKNGMVVRFDDNACALIAKNGEPLGTRINGKSDECCTHRSLKDCALLFTRWKSASSSITILTGAIGVVGSELRDKQWSKILSLASSHV